MVFKRIPVRKLCGLTIPLLVSVLALGQQAEGQRWQDAPPTRDDLPPRSRGVALNLANSGLTSGVAVIRASDRAFGVCWEGGAAPYSVVLRAAAGAELVHENNITDSELVLLSRTVSITPGNYSIEVRDSHGVVVTGRFEARQDALPPQMSSPGVDGASAIDFALSLADAGVAYRYEAYLSLLPRLRAPSAQDQMLLGRLCHRG